MRRGLVVCAMLMVCLMAGCGGGDDSEDAVRAGASRAPAASSTAAASSSVAAASSSDSRDPYDAYVDEVRGYGIEPGVVRSEAVGVAGNTCDNTVADMEGLVALGQELYPGEHEYAEYLTDRAAFIDAYCPDARVVFDAATDSVAGVTVPR